MKKHIIHTFLLALPMAVGAQDWSLTGNAGTAPATNFIGTTDLVPLMFRVNNQTAGRIERNFGAAAGVTYFGHLAGQNNVTQFSAGLYNTGVGAVALNANTFGGSNTALGFASLANNTTGNNNTAAGYNALQDNATASNNSAFGVSAMGNTLAGGNNTAVGAYALVTNNAGSNATAIGTSAMGNANNTSTAFTNRNVAVGYEALRGSFTPSANTGNGNTALGYQTLLPNTTGSNNMASGEAALGMNTTGSNCTGTGYKSLRTNTTGSGNTGCGYYALSSNTTGNNNTGVGRSSNVASSGLSNATALGYSTSVSASNKVRLGNSSITVVEGQVNYATPSDARFKREVKDDVLGLDFILGLRPVSYTFDRSAFARHVQEDVEGREAELSTLSLRRTVGFLAQEVEKAVGDMGFTAFDAVHVPENAQDNYGLAYAQFVVPLVKAVQELHQENLALKDELARLADEVHGQPRKEADGNQRLHVYPQPASDILHIQVPATRQGQAATIELVDANGRVVHAEQVETLSERFILQLPASLSKGAYVVDLRSSGMAPVSAPVLLAR